MNRKPCTSTLQLALAAALLALAASGTALADDNSMSVLTGDSYAYFNNLDYSAGKFNVARAKSAAADTGVAAMPQEQPASAGKATEKPDQPILLAGPSLRITLPSPFSDNKGA